MLPWFLRYYKSIGVDKIVVYLNSTSVDDSRAILAAEPLVELHEYDTGGVLRDDIHQQMKNTIWKKEKWTMDDWAIVIDCDEFVASSNGRTVKQVLEGLTKKKITVPLTHGYNLIGDSIPIDDGKSSMFQKRPFGISTEASGARQFGDSGYAHGTYHKPCVFRPALIKEMRYTPGAHFARPKGKVNKGKKQELHLYHAKWAFGLGYVVNRPFNLSEENHKKKWGTSFLEKDFVSGYFWWAHAHRKNLFPGQKQEEVNVENDYKFSVDWFSNRIPQWEEWFAPYYGNADPHKDREQISRGIEIGVFEGRSAVWFLENVLTAHESRLFAVDTFEGADDQKAAGIDCTGLQERFEYNVRNFKDKVRTFPEPSQSALPKISGEFDFIYVDGSHTAADVLTDAILCWRLLRVGGTMVFDDYAWRQAEEPHECPYPAIDAFLYCFVGKYDRLPADLLPQHDLQVAIRKTHE